MRVCLKPPSAPSHLSKRPGNDFDEGTKGGFLFKLTSLTRCFDTSQLMHVCLVGVMAADRCGESGAAVSVCC